MKVCYTVITDNYDTLKDPEVVSDGWQYVVFSDTHIQSDVWECVLTENHNRLIKIKGFIYMFRCLHLYVDGSIQIKGDLNQFIAEVPTWFTCWEHPHRSTVKEEVEAVINLKGISPVRVKDQYKKYVKQGYVDDSLYACGVMLRDFNDGMVKRICAAWWEEYERGVKRDQISLPYIFWKFGYKPDTFGQDVFNKYFNWGNHI